MQLGGARSGDLRSVCSLTAIEKTVTPYFLPMYPGPELGKDRSQQGRENGARHGRSWRRNVPRNLPRTGSRHRIIPRRNGEHIRPRNALIIGGGALETSEAFQEVVYRSGARRDAGAARRTSRRIPIYVMPNGDTAGARGAAIEAPKLARSSGLAHPTGITQPRDVPRVAD